MSPARHRRPAPRPDQAAADQTATIARQIAPAATARPTSTPAPARPPDRLDDFHHRFGDFAERTGTVVRSSGDIAAISSSTSGVPIQFGTDG
jgi:hypothetical protein